MAKAKTKAAGPVLQSDAEAEMLIAKIGVLQRDRDGLKTAHNDVVAELEAVYAAKKKALDQQEAAWVDALATWASAHRDRLTNGGRTKSAQLTTGTIRWQEGRYSVKYKGLNAEDVIQAVRARLDELDQSARLARAEGRKAEQKALVDQIKVIEGFLRLRTELDKQAMLADRDLAETIPGVTVPRGSEEFFVEPLSSQIREVA